MIDFIRMSQGLLIGTILTIITAIVITCLLKKHVFVGDEDAIRRTNIARNTLITIALIGFTLQASHMAIYNNVPRAVIDRTIANDRADVLDKDSHDLPPKVTDEKKKTETRGSK